MECDRINIEIDVDIDICNFVSSLDIETGDVPTGSGSCNSELLAPFGRRLFSAFFAAALIIFRPMNAAARTEP